MACTFPLQVFIRLLGVVSKTKNLPKLFPRDPLCTFRLRAQRSGRDPLFTKYPKSQSND